MLKTVLLVVAGFAAGAVAAAWLARGSVSGATPDVASSAAEAATATRIDDVERSLHEEIEHRRRLEARLDGIADALAELRDASRTSPPRVLRQETGASVPGAAAGPDVRPGGSFTGVEGRNDREARLLEAGFSPDRVQWILQRESELRMQALQARHDAARAVERFDPRAFVETDARLRQELGDTDYERYRAASGLSIRVGVSDVLEGSPAQRAGLLPGDQVVAYGGQRVYDLGDLNRLTFEGAPGETVVVDVLRDRQTIRLYVPRGPIGILSGRGRRRAR